MLVHLLFNILFLSTIILKCVVHTSRNQRETGDNKCISSLCHPYASCVDSNDGPVCTCNVGFEGNGIFCNDQDECTTTFKKCHEAAYCINTIGSYVCNCRIGYAGDGVTCKATVISTRLVDGSSVSEGRVEIFYNDEWGTICDDQWGLVDARVVCRSLGFEDATSAPLLAHFRQGRGNVWISNVNCSGNEENLGECTYQDYNISDCTHKEDASAVCTSGERCESGADCGPLARCYFEFPESVCKCTVGYVGDGMQCKPTNTYARLAGGDKDNEGRVEIFHETEWGTVCGSNWGLEDAHVICKMLGFSGASSAPLLAAYGKGIGRIWLADVHCTGSETKIDYCEHNGWGVHNCDHDQDASVVCSGGKQQVRLVGDSKLNQGIVQVLYNGVWGTICGQFGSWDIAGAHVICRMLGYKNAKASSSPTTSIDRWDIPIWLSGLDCDGDEDNLNECDFASWGSDWCGRHSQDATVVCSESISPTSISAVPATTTTRFSTETDIDTVFSTSVSTTPATTRSSTKKDIGGRHPLLTQAELIGTIVGVLAAVIKLTITLVMCIRKCKQDKKKSENPSQFQE